MFVRHKPQMDHQDLRQALESGDSKEQVAGFLKHSPSSSSWPIFSVLKNQNFPPKTKLETIGLLLDAGVPGFKPDEQTGMFSIHLACKQPNWLELVELLWKGQQEHLTTMTREGNTLLHVACAFGQYDLVVFLQQRLDSETFARLLRARNSVGALALDLLFPKPVRPFTSPPSSITTDLDEENEEVSVELRRKIHSLLQSLDGFLVPRVFYHTDCLEHLPTNVGDEEMTPAPENDQKGTLARSSVTFKKPKTVAAVAAAAKEEEEPWEGPSRLRSIMDNLAPLLSEGKLILVDTFPECDRELIETVHSPKYVDFVYGLGNHPQVSLGRPVHFSPLLIKAMELDLDSVPKDTFVSQGSLKAACRAAGAVVAAIDAVCVENQTRKAMCLVRPPGHHAGIEGIVPGATSCGFCIFNNVMIGVQHYLQTQPTGKRIAIVDIDVHHGNGTEEIIQKYYEDHPPPSATPNQSPLLFVSTHLHDSRPSKCDFYPGGEFGKDNDLVRNVINLPIKPKWRWKLDAVTNPKSWQDKFYSYHLGRSAFREMVLGKILPVLRCFQPDLLVVSAGFDTANGDAGNCDLGGSEEDGHAVGLDLEREDFHWVAHQLSQFANEVCEGKMVSVLEGGYGKLNQETGDVDRGPLGRNVHSFVNGMLGLNFEKQLDDAEPLYFDTNEFYLSNEGGTEQLSSLPQGKADEEDPELGQLAAEYWQKIYGLDQACYDKLVKVMQRDFASLAEVLLEIKQIFADSPACKDLLPGFNAFLPKEVHF
ncbi:hypothetical protein BASA81_001854 [Batrachochytrium salamandrivorans]|nr:hypothetical protein BASA81_001854 [Batrachochytrium salamandrivorans]